MTGSAKRGELLVMYTKSTFKSVTEHAVRAMKVIEYTTGGVQHDQRRALWSTEDSTHYLQRNESVKLT